MMCRLSEGWIGRGGLHLAALPHSRSPCRPLHMPRRQVAGVDAEAYFASREQRTSRRAAPQRPARALPRTCARQPRVLLGARAAIKAAQQRHP